MCLYDALGEIDRDALVFGVVDDDLLRVVRLDHDVRKASECVLDISAVRDVDEFFARRQRFHLISKAGDVMLHLERQNTECADAVLKQRLHRQHARVESCDIVVAVDVHPALQHLRDRLGVISMAMGDEAAADAACPKVAAFLNLLERNPRIEKQACFAVADAIGVAAAPRREYLDVH